ncbi:BspA family leucine rich repeat protein [Entamoeba histolytica HM-1:IMSS-B]|uniref:BspA family leucine rich repeat protein n=3 Tax=Entamoeba histolytica TaxID=5759 RepID=M3UVE4_ENTH1|nr:leucine rich repeatcontaining protein BspA family protein [Entamoeba histolytica KU27]EMH75417.1 BspA family leucine rich repeat protein [Entamoeba histolytica HM-1:IMSS-B]ENY65868.1 leucine rich repeat protein, bspa family protein [Entamoeba histolytica HM-1:IMSS-A]
MEIENKTLSESEMKVLTSIAKYLKSEQDLINFVMICKSHQNVLDCFFFNPISSTRLFVNLQEQWLYYPWDQVTSRAKKVILNYPITTKDYDLIKGNRNIICKQVKFTKQDRENLGNKIPSIVNSIEEKCFEQCIDLEQITLPSRITSLGYSSFRDCVKLSNIELPENLIRIGSCCFDHCTNLKSLTIPNTVNYIGDNAFFCCTSLTSIYLPTHLTSLGKSCFFGCNNLKNIYASKEIQNQLPYYFSSSSFAI